MPSSMNPFGSPTIIIPPTPESDITASPQSPRHISNPTNSDLADHQQSVVPLKRKAGRKPLYKTAQERRDRNRRAQLAFRARRSDYLARLEDTCRSLENVVVELQESNRAANDALAQERSRVKYLENMLRSRRSVSVFQPSNPAITVPTTDNNHTLSASSAGHRVSFPLFPQEHSLITLEQHFSSTNSPSQHTLQTPNNMSFADNYTLVLVFLYRRVTGISTPTDKFKCYFRSVRTRGFRNTSFT